MTGRPGTFYVSLRYGQRRWFGPVQQWTPDLAIFSARREFARILRSRFGIKITLGYEDGLIIAEGCEEIAAPARPFPDLDEVWHALESDVTELEPPTFRLP